MMNGTSLTWESIAGPGACGIGRPVGAEPRVHNELEVGGFLECDRGGFGKQVLGSRIRGEYRETFSKDPFETVKARIVSGDERQVVGVLGRGGWRG